MRRIRGALRQDPEALAELEATARLKIGLQRLRSSGELSELIAGPRPGRCQPYLDVGHGGRIAAAVIGVSLWFPRSGPITSPVLASAASVFKDRNGHGLSVMATAPMFRTRADKYDAVIQLPAARGAIRLRVLPSNPSETARYQASLARIKDDNTAERGVTLSDLQPSADDGFVDVYADRPS